MTSKKNPSATMKARRVSVASLGAPRGPVKYSVGAIRRFVTLKPQEAETAIMRRNLPGRPKSDERRHRLEMVAFVHNIQKSPARRRAWLAKSAPGKSASTGMTVNQALAAQTAKEKAAAMPKARLAKKKKALGRPAKVAKKARAAKPTATQKSATKASKRPAAAATPTRATKKSATAGRALLKKAGSTIGRAKKAAKKVAKRARRVAQDGVKRTIKRLEARTEAVRKKGRRGVTKVQEEALRAAVNDALETAQATGTDVGQNPPNPAAGHVYPDTGDFLDDKDRRDIEAGLPIWTGPKTDAEAERQEESVAS